MEEEEQFQLVSKNSLALSSRGTEYLENNLTPSNFENEPDHGIRVPSSSASSFDGSASSSSAFLKPRRRQLPLSYIAQSFDILHRNRTISPSSTPRKRTSTSISVGGTHDTSYTSSLPTSPPSSIEDEFIPSTPGQCSPNSTSKLLVPAEIAMQGLTLRSPITYSISQTQQSEALKNLHIRTPSYGSAVSYDSSTVMTINRKNNWNAPIDKKFTFNENDTLTSPGSIHSYDAAYLKNRTISSWTPNATPKQVPLTVLPCNLTPSSVNQSDNSTERCSRLPPTFISTIKPIGNENAFSYGKTFTPKPSPRGYNATVFGSSPLNARKTSYKSPKVNLSPRNRLPGLTLEQKLNDAPKVPDLQFDKSSPRPPNLATLSQFHSLKKSTRFKEEVTSLADTIMAHNDDIESDKISQEMDGLLNGFLTNTSSQEKKWRQEFDSKVESKLLESSNSLAFSIDDSSCSEIARLDSHNSLSSNKSLLKFRCQHPSLEISTSLYDEDYTFNLPQKICFTPQAWNKENHSYFNYITNTEGSNQSNSDGENTIGSGQDTFFLDVPNVEYMALHPRTKKKRCGMSPQKFTFIDDKENKKMVGGSTLNSLKARYSLFEDMGCNNMTNVMKDNQDTSLNSEIPSRDLITPPIQTCPKKGKSMFSPPPLIMHTFVEEEDDSSTEHDMFK